MVEGRRLEAAVFVERWLKHPLLKNLARGLVWQEEGVCFRIAEDGSLSDEKDALKMAPTQAVSLVHPLSMSPDTLNHWRRLFEDYRILQPFPQLSRELPETDGLDLSSVELTVPVPTQPGHVFTQNIYATGWKYTNYHYNRSWPGGWQIVVAPPRVATISEVKLTFSKNKEPAPAEALDRRFLRETLREVMLELS
jgi:hypothetical protein